ncbi:GNAT family N-acetyltransferase [Dysgonomonas termitidis]|uniref:GNAT family N-acetyltransferase n=1 Tax=Dysgonomonas termitidis TaxID=1516126 RepID=A0ABV9KWS3_9BACT
MKIEYLEWDSNFFRKKIGRINCPEDEDTGSLPILLEQATQDGYDLIYCFGNESFYVERVLLNEFQGTLVDRKVVFSGSTQIEQDVPLSVKEYTDIEPDPVLIHLGYLSGAYSRYKLDSHFTEADFQYFYQTWIRNSLTKRIADKTFVAYENDCIIGFITVKKYPEYGQIGLIATDEPVQGKGYGKLLIDAVKKYLGNEGLPVLEVATQFDNKGACHFYERCGLSVNRISNIYHFWLK